MAISRAPAPAMQVRDDKLSHPCRQMTHGAWLEFKTRSTHLPFYCHFAMLRLGGPVHDGRPRGSRVTGGVTRLEAALASITPDFLFTPSPRRPCPPAMRDGPPEST